MIDTLLLEGRPLPEKLTNGALAIEKSKLTSSGKPEPLNDWEVVSVFESTAIPAEIAVEEVTPP